MLKQELQSAYREILEAPFPKIPRPTFDMDIEYNMDWRFYSESSCETAAENRRERAYNEGAYFVRHLPTELNNACMKCLGQVLTQWKRMVMQAYDLSGTAYPDKTIRIAIGDTRALPFGFNAVEILLNDFNEVRVTVLDSRIEQFVKQELLHHGTSVNGVKYMSEYDCKIRTMETCDYKETLFGNIKEVNHRYCYRVSLVDFFSSAMDISRECTKALQESSFLQKYFDEVKQAVIHELKKVTGISPA